MKLRFLRTTFLSAIAAIALVSPAMSIQAAGDTVDIKLAEGTYHYDYAQEMLKETNKYRTAAGLKPVVLDKQLTDAAMQRAAECAIKFSHTRPNGEDCAFIINDRRYYEGENISESANPKASVDGWYISPGHKRTMLDPDATIMGIGAFTIDGSGGYSVQIMGSDPIVTKDTRNTKVNVKPIVEIQKSLIDLSHEEPEEIINRINSKNNSIPIRVLQYNNGAGLGTHIDASNLSWTVADPSVARVDGNGVVTELSEDRTTKVTAKLKADPSKSVTVDLGTLWDVGSSDLGVQIEFVEHNLGDTDNFGYTGKPIKPEIKVTAGFESLGNTWGLKEGVNYTVSYKNNVNIGTATLTVHGKGKYFGSISESFSISDWSDRAWDEDDLYNLKRNGFIDFVTPIDYDGYRYTGKPLEPKVKVTLFNELNQEGPTYYTLKEGTDYTVSYKDNVGNSMGWGFGKVIVKGKGKYNGTITKEFYISTDGKPLKPSTSDKPSKPATEIKVGKPKVKAKSYYNKITLTWQKTTNAEGYLVYRKYGSGAYKLIKKLPKTAKSYTDAGASYGKKYSYKVKAYHKSKLKPSKKVYGTSNVVTGKRMLDNTKLKLTTNKGKQILKWSKVKGANGYYLYQKKGNGSYKKIKTLSSKATSYTAKTKKGSTYSYKIVGYRVIKGKKCLGEYSPVVKAKAK